MNHAFLFIVFTRSEAVLANLKEIEANNTSAEIVIFFDAPYDAATYRQWLDATSKIESYVKNSRTFNAEIIYSPINLKGRRSVPTAISHAAEKYDFVTVIEDDILLDVVFVNLVLDNKMLREALEREYAALCLCPIFERSGTTVTIIETDIFSSWGWILSTRYWRRKLNWYELDSDTLKIQNTVLLKHKSLSMRFQRIINGILSGKIGSWDAVFFYEMHLNNRKCLFTSKNLASATNVTEGTAQNNKKVRSVNEIRLAKYSDVDFTKIHEINREEYNYIWKKNYKGRIQWLHDLIFIIVSKLRFS